MAADRAGDTTVRATALECSRSSEVRMLMSGDRVAGAPAQSKVGGTGSAAVRVAARRRTLVSMAEGAEIRFLRFDGRRVAYALTGGGPPLLAPAWWVSHLELDWADQTFRDVWESVAEGYALVRYDRLGVGMSDRDVGEEELTVEGEIALLTAVLDELGLERVVLAGGSSGGCAAITFAARFPERVDRLLLYGAYADGSSITSPEVRDAIVATMRSHWGLGSRVLADIFLGEASSAQQEQLARYQRARREPGDRGAAAGAGLPQRCSSGVGGHTRPDAGCASAGRSRDSLPPRPGARGRHPGSDADPVGRRCPFPVGRGRSVGGACAAIGARPRTPARVAGEPAAVLLSGREREVLALVASGLSDREIAEQLVVSQHTVHRHVANIRHKLGRGSRAAAVAEAGRLGLL